MSSNSNVNYKTYQNLQWLKQIRGLPSLKTYQLINQVKQIFISKHFNSVPKNELTKNSSRELKQSKLENLHEKQLNTMIGFSSSLKTNLNDNLQLLNSELDKSIENLKWLDEIVN